MVAIVVTGLGLNEAGTLDAVDKLPADMSLAFAPYGKTLDAHGRGGPRRRATRCCSRCRSNRSTIPTPIPARKPC